MIKKVGIDSLYPPAVKILDMLMSVSMQDAQKYEDIWMEARKRWMDKGSPAEPKWYGELILSCAEVVGEQDV